MTNTAVWQNDKHAVSWGARSDGTPVDLSTADAVRLIARNLNGSAAIDLACTVAVDVVTHQLTGTLAPASYKIVTEATTGTQVITYPAPDAEQQLLIVQPDVG